MSIYDEHFNVAVFGSDVSSSTLLDAVDELAYTYQLCIRNCAHTLSYVKELHKKHITTKTLEELLVDRSLSIILLCLSPYMQYKTITKLTEKGNFRKVKSDGNCDIDICLPHLVLIPPVVPLYNTDDLCNFKNEVGFAMPLRLLPNVCLLHDHLKSIREPTLSWRSATSLPIHWTLGELQYIHIRVATANPIQRGSQYSWLCEPGGMGGGLLNRFGAELVDLLYRLSGGLMPLSVTCTSRVSDSAEHLLDNEWKTEHKEPRYNSADDYVLVTGELEMSSKNGLFAYTCGPVFTLCLSADLPASTLTDTVMKNEEFSLSVEISGSTGHFTILDSGDQIHWFPKTRSSKINLVNQMDSIEISNIYTCNDPLSEPTAVQLNGYLISDHKTNSSTEISISLPPENQITYPIRLSRKNSFVEVAHLSTTSSGVKKTYPIDAIRTPPAVQDAWFTWCRSLPSALKSAKASTSQPAKSADLDFLVASPSHWAQLQHVIRAIDKAAQLHCSIDVATHSQLT